MKQNAIVIVHLSRFVNTKHSLCVVDVFEDIVDGVLYCSHTRKQFLCVEVEMFEVVIVVYIVWIKVTATIGGR